MAKSNSEDVGARMADALKAQIKEHLRKERITQAALAERLGCTRANVSKLLRKGSNTTLASLSRLADAVGLELVTVAKNEERRRKATKQERGRESPKPLAAVAEVGLDRASTSAQARRDALEAYEQLSPEARAELRKFSEDRPRRRGRKEVPPSEYRAHLEHMADLLVEAERSGADLGERKASRNTAEWAEKENGLNVYSPETLRSRFRKDKDALLEAAREKRREKDAIQEKERRRKASRRSRSRTAASPTRQSGASKPAKASSLANQHLASMADRFRLNDRVVELLRRPEVFEETCRVAASDAEALVPVKPLKEFDHLKDLLDQTQAYQADQVPDYTAEQTKLRSIPRIPENLATKPIDGGTLSRQLTSAHTLSDPAADARKLTEWATGSSKPIETGITSILEPTVNQRMSRIFEDFKVLKNPFD